MKRIVIQLISLLALLAWMPSASAGGVIYEEDGPLSDKVKLPIYHWHSASSTPVGLVIAVHGVAMHGRSYDALGRQLAGMGFDVYATDMRGYGRNHVADHRFCAKPDCKHKVDYDKSFEDLVLLTQKLRLDNPGIPIHFVGESLGSSISIRMAAEHPELTDGLVLAAPALKRHSFVHKRMVKQAGALMANFRAQLDLTPYVKTYASDDPQILAELASDPLLRRRQTACDLLKANTTVKKTLDYVRYISPETPVLVIQGSADRCIKANAVVLLLNRLRSKDQTVRWFHSRGHILLETAFVKPDTMHTVCGWLQEHTDGALYTMATPNFDARGRILEKTPTVSIDSTMRPQTHF